MAYFSSGTEGMDYEARYCERCIHYKEPDAGTCLVWMLHMLFVGVSAEEGPALVPLFHGAKDGARWHGPTARQFLDTLIPTKGPNGIWNDECAMFVPAEAPAADA